MLCCLLAWTASRKRSQIPGPCKNRNRALTRKGITTPHVGNRIKTEGVLDATTRRNSSGSLTPDLQGMKALLGRAVDKKSAAQPELVFTES